MLKYNRRSTYSIWRVGKVLQKCRQHCSEGCDQEQLCCALLEPKEKGQWCGICDGERAPIVKREDNLKPEGTFSKKAEEVWRPGERAERSYSKQDRSMVFCPPLKVRKVEHCSNDLFIYRRDSKRVPLGVIVYKRHLELLQRSRQDCKENSF